jgi:hypothetical protein
VSRHSVCSGYESSRHQITRSPRPLILSAEGFRLAHASFMRSLQSGTRSCQFGLGHVASKPADIVL